MLPVAPITRFTAASCGVLLFVMIFNMRDNKLKVTINKSAAEVFGFVINPDNTPKWIDGLIEETTNESPVGLGTKYRNRNKDGEWSEYVITKFVKDKVFVMSKQGSNYRVQYTLKSIGAAQVNLEYYEWVDEGDLEEPFTEKILNKLKAAIEQGR